MRNVRPSRSLATGIAVWVLVVALGSALVWVVISRAGDGVVSSQAPITSATDEPEPGRTPKPSTSPGTTPSDSAEPATSDPVRRTWQGVGGQVTVSCQGSAASFVNAIPDSGFVFEIDDRGPDRVRVEFERDADDDQRSRIEVSCVDGTPRFEPEVDFD